MQYSKFAGSNDLVSRIGFGAMRVSESADDSVRAILYSLDRGVNMIDTARGYGGSEIIVAKALKEWRGERPFIATKVASRAPGGWYSSVPVEQAYPIGSITASVEESLKALDIETIDLIQTHQYWAQWDDSDYWMDELIRLKEAGKVRYIGVSIPDLRHDVGISIARSGHIDAVHTMINIFEPLAFDSLIPVCEKHQVAVIARCVLDEGGLAGFLTENTSFGSNTAFPSYFDYYPRQLYINRVNHLRKYIPEHAGSLAALAIKFALLHPAVTTAVLSMQVLEYAEQNIAALEETPLSGEMFETLRKSHRWMRNFNERKFTQH
jgi:aryl-alcohol dehydrogenase-like predicted oxidoreductase